MTATAVAGLTFAVSPARAAHPIYDEIDLGAMLGASSSRASHVNENGDVLVRATVAGEPRGYLWSVEDGFVDIGNLGNPNVVPRDMNDAGQIVGDAASEALTNGSLDLAFIWTPGGTMTDLGTLGGTHARATAINNAGTVVGASNTPTESHAFVWSAADGMVDIGASGWSSVAVDVNEAGAVAGTETLFDPPSGQILARRGFYWTAELGAVPIGGPADGVTPVAISDSGLVTGFMTGTNGVFGAFVWTLSGGFEELGSPLGGGTFPTAVNASGQVVGRAYTAGDSEGYGFFWSESTGMTILPFLGTEETEPVAINASGQVVGYSVSDADGDEHWFTWTHDDGIVDLGLGDAQDLNDAGQIVGRMRTPGATAFLLTPVVPPDADGDGIDDVLQVAGQPSAFADGNAPVTFGSVVDANGHTVTVADEPSPDGVRITVSGTGTAKATFSVCGMTLRLAPGAEIVATCGSLTVDVVSGPAEVEFADGRVVVSIPDGSTVKITDLVDDGHQIDHVAGHADVVVTIDGEAAPLAPEASMTASFGDSVAPSVTCTGDPVFTLRQAAASVSATVSDDDSGPAAASVSATVDVSTVGSFTAPVTGADVAGNVTTVDCPYSVVYAVEWALPVSGISANRSVLRNTVVPFTFRVVDAAGRGVGGAVVTATTSTPATCPAGTPPLALSVPGNAATTNVGQGWWLAGWKAQTAWKGTCRLVSINLDDGVARTVLIKVV